MCRLFGIRANCVPAEDYLNGSGKTKENVLPDIKARVELCKEYFAQYGVTLADKQ